MFELLADRGVVDIRIVESTATEASAAWTFDTVERTLAHATGGRTWVSRIAAQESGNEVITLTALPAQNAQR